MLTDALAGPVPRCSTDGCPNWVWTRSTADGLGERIPVSNKCYRCANGALHVEIKEPAPAKAP